jgi:uncharacterized membrane protein
VSFSEVTTRRRRVDGAGLVVWIAGAVFFGLYAYLTVRQYRRFHVTAFDFAIFDQGLWLLGELETPFVTVRGLHLFADHSSYVLVPLAFVYRLWPKAESLIVLTVALLALGGPLSYWVSRRAGASRLLAAVVGLGYLLTPAVAWNARDGFHPEIIVLPLVIAAFGLLLRDRDAWAIGAIVVALSAKEDVALLVVPFGLWVAWQLGKRRTGLAIAGLGFGAMALSFFVLLPHFSPTGELLYSDRYAQLGDGPAGVAIGLLTRPGVVLPALTDPWRVGYVAALVLPMPLCLLAPRALLIAVPTVLANVLSAHVYQYDIRYHYTLYIVAAVVIAAAVGASRMTGRSESAVRRAVGFSLVTAICFQLTIAPNPLGLSRRWAIENAENAGIEAALSMIPDDAVVSAWTTFVPHLSHRKTVYVFPNPWRRHNYGPLDAEMPEPRAVQWVISRTDVDPEFLEVLDQLRDSGEFVPVYESEEVVLMRRPSAGSSQSSTASTNSSGTSSIGTWPTSSKITASQSGRSSSAHRAESIETSRSSAP